MKVSDIAGVRPILEKIAGKEMDAKVAVKFANFLRDVLVEIQAFEAKRAELFQKYGELAGEGDNKTVQIPEANQKKFESAMKRALNKKVEIKPFDLGSLGVSVSPADLINALPLFK